MSNFNTAFFFLIISFSSQVIAGVETNTQGKSTTVYESNDNGKTSVEITKTPNGQKVITRSSSGTDISIQQSTPAKSSSSISKNECQKAKAGKIPKSTSAKSSSSISKNECQKAKAEKIPTAEEFKQKITSRMRPLSN